MSGQTPRVTRKSISGKWRLCGRDRNGDPLDLDARVPGVVHWDLERAGIIENPFPADNEKRVQWVERRDWTYSRDFQVPRELAGRRHIELVFEGLDTFASITLNGKLLAETDNMFVPWRFDVTGLILPGKNHIEVTFLSPVEVGIGLHRTHREVKLYEGADNPRAYLRKAQYSFGWDWGPRLATSGIWREVYLEAWDEGRIENVYWRTLSADESTAEVAVEVEVAGERGLTCGACLSYGKRRLRVPLKRVRSGHFAGRIVIRKPHLWWPAGQGKPHLYRGEVVLSSKKGVVERRVERIGIRTVELIREKDSQGESFQVAVNGRRIFCKGANWIPADSYLPRLTKSDYDAWVKTAVDANMNMLRVWGGGIYETESFYRACDRRGILVWQDFPFACAMYPEGKWFTDNVRREAELAVKALRNHPSLALWCGNNENHWAAHSWWPDDPFGGKTIYNRLLPEVVRRLDPSRPYWPGSPYRGRDPNSRDRGDTHHWEVWSGWRDYREYLNDRGRFVSEFGFQAPPPIESVAEFGPLEELHPQHPLFEYHNKQAGGPERLARFLSAVFPPAESLDEFVYLSGLVQAEAIKTGVLHWRSRQMKTAGALYWQLNDCWPVCSWSALDYRRRPKALWYYTRRFFAPLAVRVAELDGGVSAWAINDSPQTLKGRLELVSLDFEGRVLGRFEAGRSIEPMGVRRLGPFSRQELCVDDPRRQFVMARFVVGGKEMAWDWAFFLRPKHLRLGDPGIRVKVERAGGALVARVEARRLAYGVFLALPGTDAHFADNYVTILPGGRALLRITGSGMTAGEASGRLVVRWAPGGLAACETA